MLPFLLGMLVGCMAGIPIALYFANTGLEKTVDVERASMQMPQSFPSAPQMGGAIPLNRISRKVSSLLPSQNKAKGS
jgi:hypothetical protein